MPSLGRARIAIAGDVYLYVNSRDKKKVERQLGKENFIQADSEISKKISSVPFHKSQLLIQNYVSHYIVHP